MNKTILYIIPVLTMIIFIVGCESEKNNHNDVLNFTYNFNSSSEGFIVNKTDVPTNYSDADYEFAYELEEIPIDGNATKALSIEYNNKNEDMFTYVFKEIGEGNSVEANTSYNATLDFDIGTNIDDKAVGDKTYVKAGITSRLPLPEEKSETIEFNLDKGNNEQEGEDLKTLEGITKPNTTSSDYEYKSYTMNNQVTANRNGMIYAIIGLDSTYDGKVKYYVDNVNIKLEKVKSEETGNTDEQNND